MKLWKRNAIIATVLLFVCAGIYLNWSYTQDGSVEDLTATLSENKLLGEDTLTINDAVDSTLTDAAQEGLPVAGEDATEYFSEVRLSRQEARDSAVTMLMMKHLTSTKLWMANPGLQPDGTVNFSHCTAPICCMGDSLPCTLRSHHESGIGVSLQVELPQKKRVTACRISDEASKMTVHLGYSAAGPYETACRTQMHVRFDDAPHYLRTVLGCHQVFAFEDVEEKLLRLAALFGLDVL